MSAWFTIDQTKDCINETERHLRDIASTILGVKFGPAWEKTSFPNEVLNELEQRRETEKERFPNQSVSDHLIDYTDLSHLMNLIDKHWDAFSGIYNSKGETMLYLGKLQNMRDPEMHSREQLTESQKHFCLGICGELVLATERWREGYRHRVKHYSCDLRFSVYESDHVDAQSNSKQLAQSWLTTVSRMGNLEERSFDENSKECLLRLSKGHVKVLMRWNYRGNDGAYFRSSNVQLLTTSIQALDDVIREGRHPYWVLCWTLEDGLDVSIVASHIREKTGNRPSSSGQTVIGSGLSLITNASYNIAEFDSARIRVDLDRGTLESGSTVKLVHDGASKGGFFNAHSIFRVEDILSILYGERTNANVQESIRKACTMSSNSA